MNDDKTFNHRILKDKTVKHRQLEQYGKVVVASALTNEVIVKWNNGQTLKINISELDLVEDNQ